MSACSQTQSLTITSDQSLINDGSLLSTTVGQNVSLICNVNAVPSGSPPVWYRDNYIYIYPFEHDINEETCTLLSTVDLVSVSYNDSGNYTCIYGDLMETLTLVNDKPIGEGESD